MKTVPLSDYHGRYIYITTEEDPEGFFIHTLDLKKFSREQLDGMQFYAVKRTPPVINNPEALVEVIKDWADQAEECHNIYDLRRVTQAGEVIEDMYTEAVLTSKKAELVELVTHWLYNDCRVERLQPVDRSEITLVYDAKVYNSTAA